MFNEKITVGGNMKFKRLKDLREENELKQYELSNFLGIDNTTYSGWETGKDTISLRKLSKLCDYYNVSIDYMLELTDVKNYNIINQNIDLEVVGKNLRIMRKELKLLQKDIFELLNTTSSTYSAYETGKVLMQTTFIYIIAKEYGYSIDWILGKTTNKKYEKAS